MHNEYFYDPYPLQFFLPSFIHKYWERGRLARNNRKRIDA